MTSVNAKIVLNSKETEPLTIVSTNFELLVDSNNIINKEEETKKLHLLKAKLEAEVERSQKILSNQNFVAKAPQEKLALEKEKLADYQNQLEVVLKKLELLLK